MWQRLRAWWARQLDTSPEARYRAATTHALWPADDPEARAITRAWAGAETPERRAEVADQAELLLMRETFA